MKLLNKIYKIKIVRTWMILNLYNKNIIIRILIKVGNLIKLNQLMLKKNRPIKHKKIMKFKIKIN